MNPREGHYHLVHSQPRPAGVVDYDHRATSGKLRQLKSLIHVNRNVAVFQIGTLAPIALHCEALRRVQSTVAFVAYEWGRLSCMGLYRSARRKLAKQSVRIGGRPTDLSATFFPTSQSLFFGLKIQRQTSQACAGAACARPSVFSGGTASGPAMPSLRSCKKFSSVAA